MVTYHGRIRKKNTLSLKQTQAKVHGSGRTCALPMKKFASQAWWFLRMSDFVKRGSCVKNGEKTPNLATNYWLSSYILGRYASGK